jgi:hypothetical protein
MAGIELASGALDVSVVVDVCDDDPELPLPQPAKSANVKIENVAAKSRCFM